MVVQDIPNRMVYMNRLVVVEEEVAVLTEPQVMVPLHLGQQLLASVQLPQ